MDFLQDQILDIELDGKPDMRRIELVEVSHPHICGQQASFANMYNANITKNLEETIDESRRCFL